MNICVYVLETSVSKYNLRVLPIELLLFLKYIFISKPTPSHPPPNFIHTYTQYTHKCIIIGKIANIKYVEFFIFKNYKFLRFYAFKIKINFYFLIVAGLILRLGASLIILYIYIYICIYVCVCIIKIFFC